MSDTAFLLCVYAPVVALWIAAEIATARAMRLHNSEETKALNAEYERRMRELREMIR